MGHTYWDGVGDKALSKRIIVDVQYDRTRVAIFRGR